MIFYINVVLDNKQQPVVLSAKNKDGNYHTFLEFLRNNKLLPALARDGEYIRLKGNPETNTVYTVCDIGYPSNVNFTVVGNLLAPKIEQQLPDNIFDAIASKINAQVANANFSARDVLEFFKGLKEYVNYKNNKISVKIEYNVEYVEDKAITLPIIDRINSAHSLSYLGDSNKTLFMNSPEDELFLKLPAYEQLGTDDSFVIPKPTSVFKAYENKELYTMKYRDFLGNTPIEHVVGNASNNDLDIQENEKKFYDAMKQLIEFGIKQTYPNNTLEECINSGYDDVKVTTFLLDLAMEVASWNWAHTGNYPVGSEMFEDDVDNEEYGNDANSSQGEATYGRKIYHTNPYGSDERVTLDAEYLLRDYIMKATEKNIYAPAEAVVKLLRWGNRKPSKLKLTGIDSYLNLNNLKLENTSGSFDNLEPIKIDGSTYSIIGIITATNSIKDISYLKSLGLTNTTLNIPVGVITTRMFEGGIKQYVMFSIPSLLNYIENHEGDVAGIKITKDAGVVSDLELEEGYTLDTSISIVNSSSDGSKIFFREEELIDMYMEYQLLSSKTSYLTILDKFLKSSSIKEEIDEKSFQNTSELIEKYAIENGLNIDSSSSNNKNLLRGMNGLKDYLDATIASKLLPIVLAVAQENYNMRLKQQRTASFNEILNFYAINMTKYNFNSRNWLKESGDLDPNSTGGKIANQLDKMSSFGSNQQSPHNSTQSDNSQQNTPNNTMSASLNAGLDLVRKKLLVPMPANGAFVPVQFNGRNKDGNPEVTVIGYINVISIDGKKRYLFVSKLNPTMKVLQQMMNANQILKVVLRDYFYAMTGKPEMTSLRFVDEKDWLTLANQVLSVVK